MKQGIILFLIFFAVVGYSQNTWIDVRKFGAVGNGRVDDSESFQNALDYCNTNSGVGLKISKGRYLLTRQLLVTKSISIKGELASTLIVDSKVSNNLFYFYKNASTVTLSGLFFDGSSNRNTRELLRFESVKHVAILNCIFLGQMSNGFNNSQNITLTKNTFKHNSQQPAGPCDFFSCSKILIEDNLFESAGGIQFIKSCNYIEIKKNRFYNMRGYPVHFDGGDKVPHRFILIEGNELIGSGQIAFKGGTYDQLSLFNAQNIEIGKNSILKSGDMGITLASCKNVLVWGNTINYNNVAAISMINSINCILEDNIMENNGIRPEGGIDPKARAGIYIYGAKSYSSDSILLKNNKIKFINNKWKTYPISVSTTNKSIHRFFIYDSSAYPTTGEYSNEMISQKAYINWKNKLLRHIRF